MGKAPTRKLFLDESGIWNLDELAAGETSNPNMNIRAMMMGYMWNNIHVEQINNIRGSSKNLASMSLPEKTPFLDYLLNISIKMLT